MAEAHTKSNLSPDLQRLIAEEVAKGIAAAAKSDHSDPMAAMRAMISEMTLGIAEMNHQGSGRPKPVSPETIAKRQAASERCVKLLRALHDDIKTRGRERMRAEDALPRYRVISKIYYGERFIEPWRRAEGRGSKPVQTEIEFTSVPNEAMKPINAAAEAIYDAYRESIGQMASIKGQDNRPFWMTPEGLVVKGDPPPKAFVASGHDMTNTPALPHDNTDPEAEFIHVLGTVLPPARQNVPGQR